MTRTSVRIAVLAAMTHLPSHTASAQTPLDTVFTYQGQLNNGGSPANGLHDLRFRLYDLLSDGAPIGNTVCADNVSVTDGVFTASPDFGAQFAGEQRFLEIEVRSDTGLDCDNLTGFTTLAPRQELTAAPNALFALNADRLDGLNSTAFLQSIPVPLTLSGTSATHIIRGENAATGIQATAVYGLATGATGLTYGGRFTSASPSGRGVYGNASATSGSTFGGEFESLSSSGIGVSGVALNANGPTYGVYAESKSDSGRAVYAYASNSDGITYGGYFHNQSKSGRGVFGIAAASSGTNYGGYFHSQSPSGNGVFGLASAGTGFSYGGRFQNASTSGFGISGEASATTGGTYGVFGSNMSVSGRGVYGIAHASSGFAYGVHGQSASTDGRGVFGYATAATGATSGLFGWCDSTDGRGVYGEALASLGTTYGVYGLSNSTDGRGVYGKATAFAGVTYGGRFESASTEGRGVFGLATAASGTTYGVWGQSDSTSGTGVYGQAAAGSGVTNGGWFQVASPSGRGVYGEALGGGGGTGVYGIANTGIGVHGKGIDGVWGQANGSVGIGVWGNASGTNANGVRGTATAGSGGTTGGFFQSLSDGGRGVFGEATSIGGTTYGGSFLSRSTNGTGVIGQATATSGFTVGVYGLTNSLQNGYGVYSSGNMGASGTKPFRIDHPDDPENKYLLHYATESPEVINFYRGTVVLDGAGQAVVELPRYFAKINKTPSYQLTAVGAPMPMLHVAAKIREADLSAGAGAEPGEVAPICSFRIAGGAPGGEVSWRVEAVRNDRWVQKRGAPVEIEKPGREKGTYQHPELYGQPPEWAMDYRPETERVTSSAASDAPIVRNGR